MRQAGTIPNEADAKRFVDYLLTEGIEAQAESTADGPWTLWIVDEADVARGKELLAQFLAQPNLQIYTQADKAGELRRQEAQRRKQAARNVVEVSRRWNAPLARRAPVTMVVIVLCGIVALLTEFGDKPDPVMPWLMIQNVQKQPAHRLSPMDNWGLGDVAKGEVWRLFTPALLHFGALHLLFNMYWAYVLGGLIEARKGSLWFVIFLLVVAGVSNVVQLEATGPNFGGFSGVAFGLFGFVWMKSRFDPRSGFYMPQSTVVWMMLWFAICTTGKAGPVANWAHGAGLVSGGLIAFLPDWHLPRRP
jgi:GlpG protein